MCPVADVKSHVRVRRADNLLHGWKNTRKMWQRLLMLNSPEQIGKRPPQSSTNLQSQTTWPKKNHIIKWDEAKILDRDSNTFSRRIREAIEIRKKGAKAINRDEGSFTLDHVYDSLLCTTSHPRKENNNKFPGKSHEPRHLWSSHQPRWRKRKFVCIQLWICQT